MNIERERERVSIFYFLYFIFLQSLTSTTARKERSWAKRRVTSRFTARATHVKPWGPRRPHACDRWAGWVRPASPPVKPFSYSTRLRLRLLEPASIPQTDKTLTPPLPSCDLCPSNPQVNFSVSPSPNDKKFNNYNLKF